MTTQIEPNPSMLGAKIRPPDPKEVKYRLRMAELPDMTQVVSLGGFMPPVEEAQTFGSCTGYTVEGLMYCLYAIVTGSWPPTRVDPYVIYYLARLLQNFFGGSPDDDTGAYLADAFDVALEGIGSDRLWPTPSSPGEQPNQAVMADAPNQNWLLGHQPAYASDPGGFQAGLVTALRTFKPVGLAMAWYANWFGHHEILPTTTGDLSGYHAIKAYAYIPAGILHEDWLAVERNSWGGYTDVRQLKTVIPEAMPGDVAIPGRFFTNGAVMELRAATAEKIVIEPESEPNGDCAAEITATRQTDAGLVLRVRDQYRTKTAINALTKAAHAIQNQL